MIRWNNKVGVIGAGSWGRNLVRNCAELGVLGGVCDASPGVLENVRQQYPRVMTYREADALIAAPLDAVIIAAPAPLHAPLALQAIAAKKHTFVEKPLALTVEDGEAIARAGRAAGVQVFVGHLLLYHPAVQKLMELVSRRVVGDVWHVRSRRLNLGKVRTHEDVWWSFAPHDVALMMAILGAEPVRACAATSGHLAPDICDMAYADFEFEGGRSAHIEVGWLDPQKSQRLDVFGTDGVITLEDSRSGANLRVSPCGVRSDDFGSPRVWREDSYSVQTEVGEPLRREIEAFLRSADAGVPAETDAEAGVKVLRALAMADAGARRSRLRLEVHS